MSNATLQWVADHLALLPRLVDAVAPDGWLAFQVLASGGSSSSHGSSQEDTRVNER